MSQISLRIDEELKQNVEKILDDMGLSMSAAITMFLKKVNKECRIPFEITADPFYSESNVRYLENLMNDVKEGNAHFEEHELTEE